ncbi:MAG TPA: hypothetical protein VJQ43_02555, partial [Thermoplasmata archaeon]|nr:hypothetical protein [Thermoplasmata archaeon]
MEQGDSGTARFGRLLGWLPGYRFPWPSPATAYWGGATALSVAAAIVLVLVFRETPVPAGGDPGNWVATSLAYIARPYPGQLYPLGYPPIVFPLLGGAVLLAGGPVAGVELFAAGLMVAFGLSVAALAATIVRNRVVALGLVAFVLADPAVLAMFFWGAYPNLLGFVFLHLALVGLIRAGQGHTTTGAAQFWGFFALATLSHSLVGIVLGLTTALYLGLGLSVPLARSGELLERARRGTLDAPGVAGRALFGSRGGRAGLMIFVAFVGGYYGLTYLAGVPHPYYLASDPVGFRLLSMSGAFEALVPNVVVQPSLVLALLATGCLLAIVAFALVRDHRPRWLTSSSVLLLAWPLAVSLLFIGGYLAQIVTDYHRFGFFYIVPVGLLLAYLLDRGWVARPARAPDVESSGSLGELPRRRLPRFVLDASARRPLVFGAFATVILVTVVDTATIPALAHDEASFTRVGHDQAFLDAVRAIQTSGTSGGILTVAGADKWVRGLTGENAFAPYSTDDYLFYPSQRVDSQLSYYALSSHYAMTNGLVAASIRAVHPSQSDGIPDYSVYVLGTPRPMLRLPPSDVRVLVHDASNGSTFATNLTKEPSVVLPNSLADPMVVRYGEPDYTLTVAISVVGAAPRIDVHVAASAALPFTIVEVDAAVAPPTGGSALAWPSSAPGGFLWSDIGGLRKPLTYGNVTPVGALRGATDYDATTGGPAALLAFAAASASGSAEVGGDVAFTTPAATAYLSGVPSVLSTPGIWQTLGIRFVLLRNTSVGPTPYLNFPDEVPYLVEEYGLVVAF